jgi:prolyl-tRNA synthetase
LILGKKSEGDTFEFKEVGKETQNLKIEEIITQIKKAKSN